MTIDLEGIKARYDHFIANGAHVGPTKDIPALIAAYEEQKAEIGRLKYDLERATHKYDMTALYLDKKHKRAEAAEAENQDLKKDLDELQTEVSALREREEKHAAECRAAPSPLDHQPSQHDSPDQSREVR